MSKCITVSVVSHAHDSALRRLLGDLATYSYGNVLQVIVTFNIPSNSTLAWLHATDWPFDIDILIGLLDDVLCSKNPIVLISLAFISIGISSSMLKCLAKKYFASFSNIF